MFRFTKQHLYLVLLLLILIIPNIVLVAVGEDFIVISSIKKIGFLAFSIAFISFPLLIFRPKFYAFFMLFLSFLIVFEVYVIVHYKAPSSEEIVGTLFYTNMREAMEFLKSSLLYLILFIAVIQSVMAKARGLINFDRFRINVLFYFGAVCKNTFQT